MFPAPIVKDVVLLGGGHSHIEVLRSWGMKQAPAGVRLTLITRDVHTPYSGMLPGYVSGFYSYDECHIDLCRLATFARARLIHAEAKGIDTKARRVLLPGRPPVRYDALSVDIGITPAAAAVPGAAQYTTAVKPIDRFVSRFDALLSRVRASPTPVTVVIVGGGAGGVELALAVKYRLRQERSGGLGASAVGGDDVVKVICRGLLLGDRSQSAAAALRRICRSSGVELHEHSSVQRVEAHRLLTDDGRWQQFDECLWCTQAAAAEWIKQTGLPTDASGFLLINEYLQSAGGPPEIFAAGDVATSVTHPRPKAGVYAVRQGPALSHNLRCFITGQPLKPFTPQAQALALISTGNKYAVGTRGWITFEGDWVWTWKDKIDRTFMDKYSTDLNFDMTTAAGSMHSSSSSSSSWWQWISSMVQWGQAAAGPQQQQLGAARAVGPDGPEHLAAAAAAAAGMRCGGCGSKIGSQVLNRVLKKVRQQQQQQLSVLNVTSSTLAASADKTKMTHNNNTISSRNSSNGQVDLGAEGKTQSSSSDMVYIGLGSDDAAVLAPPPAGHVVISTVDHFTTFWPDNYLLGAIAANHALGDCYAMGARPSSALAIAVLPPGGDEQQESELTDLITAAGEVMAAAGCQLVGGHSSEGAAAAAGFCVMGHAAPDQLMTKSALQPGQLLLLTKPLGTGTLLAAAARGAARGRDVMSCLRAMQVSSAEASVILQQHGCRAATDVTGFGLIGHAAEMAAASKVQIQIYKSSVPSLSGALDSLKSGITSTLHPSNSTAAAAVIDNSSSSSTWSSCDPSCMLLCDPQTAGGLLAGVAAAAADACVSELRAAGYSQACVVGRVVGGMAAAEGEELKGLIQIVEGPQLHEQTSTVV